MRQRRRSTATRAEVSTASQRLDGLQGHRSPCGKQAVNLGKIPNRSAYEDAPLPRSKARSPRHIGLDSHRKVTRLGKNFQSSKQPGGKTTKVKTLLPHKVICGKPLLLRSVVPESNLASDGLEVNQQLVIAKPHTLKVWTSGKASHPLGNGIEARAQIVRMHGL